jgi:hypothetical protein
MMMLGEFLLTLQKEASPDWDVALVAYAPNGKRGDADVVIYNRYNLPGTSQHFLTTNGNFEDGHLPHPPWILEGGAFWVHKSHGPGRVPIIRWFLGMDHVWVIGEEREKSFERQLHDHGFRVEGPDGYLFTEEQPNNTTVPVYRGSHMFENCLVALDPEPDGSPGVVYGPSTTARLNALTDANAAAEAFARQHGYTNWEHKDGPC